MYSMTLQGFPLMSGFVLGAAATGSLRAATAIVGVLNILLLALDNFAPVQAARAVHIGGAVELYRNIVRLALLTGTLVVATLMLINIDPEDLLRVLYGEHFADVAELVRWLCAPVAVHAICAVLVIWAAALERTRIIYVSYVAAIAVTVIAAYPMTRYGGLAGVVAGTLLVEASRAAVLLVSFFGWRRAVMSEAVTAKRTMPVRRDLPWEMKEGLYRSGLRLLAASGMLRVMARRGAGQGAILSFHRIYAPRPHEFGSHSLSITPENFRRIIQALRERGYDFLTMSALADRLRDGGLARQKVVCLTFDDGFVDTYTEAHPICRELGVPMTVYLVSAFLRREFPMWSFGLDEVFAANDELKFTWEGKEIQLDIRTMGQKRQAYSTVAARFALAQPQEIKRACAELGGRYGVDFMALSDRNALTQPMIAEMRASGLVEFGAHTVHHLRLSCLNDSDARREILQSKRDCESFTGTEIRHFAYPYGDKRSFGAREIRFCREMGLKTAVTTDGNTIFASDHNQLLALPRLSYNGRFQDTPLLDLLLSGTLPRLRRGFRATYANAL